jgi:O-antigen ligase
MNRTSAAKRPGNATGYWGRRGAYSGKPAMPMRVLPAVAAGLLMGFAVLGGANTGFMGAMLACGQGLFAACVFALMPRAADWWRAIAPVAFPAALLAVWAMVPGVAGLALSPDLYPLGLVELVGHLLFLLAMISLGGHPGAYRRFVDWMTAMTAPLIAAVLVLPGSGLVDMAWLGVSGSGMGRFSGSIGNPNVAAVMFAMFALLAAGVAMGRFRNWLARPTDRSLLTMGGASVLAATGMCLLAATQSRTGIMLFLLAQALLCTCALLFTKNGAMPGRRRVTACVAILGGIGAIFLLLASDRFEMLSEDGLGRFAVWQKFLPLAHQAPWTGYGLGSFVEFNQWHLTAQDALTMWDFGAAHAAPLQVVLELGWPGLGLMAAIGLGAMWRIVRAGRLHADPIGLSMMLAILLALGASLVDIDLNVPAVMALVLSLAGASYGRATAIEVQSESDAPAATWPETMRNW